jgi:hypothetical protein
MSENNVLGCWYDRQMNGFNINAIVLRLSSDDCNEGPFIQSQSPSTTRIQFVADQRKHMQVRKTFHPCGGAKFGNLIDVFGLWVWELGLRAREAKVTHSSQ